MAHIHTISGQHDNTVSAFIVHEEKEAVLLHRHRKLGLLVQPGGHVELHENPWEAIAHELDEETGYSLSQLEVLSHSPSIRGLEETIHPIPLAYRSHHFPGTEVPHFHTDAAFGFVTNQLPLKAPHEDESQDLLWLTASELESISASEIIHDTRVIALHLLTVYKTMYRTLAGLFDH